MLYSSVTTGNFFFLSSYHICDQFLWTCSQKNICIANWLLLLKKDLQIKAERRRNHRRQKKSYFRRPFGPLHGKQEISKVLYSFFVWTMKSVERVFQTFSGSKVYPLKRNIKRPSTNLLFVCWLGKLEVLLFERNVSCLNCFFLPF